MLLFRSFVDFSRGKISRTNMDLVKEKKKLNFFINDDNYNLSE